MPPSDPEDRAHRPAPGADAPAPVLRRQPAPESPIDGIDAPFAAARLTALTHELANLLDGSMRCLGLAQRSLTPNASAPAALLPDADLARRLDTVGAALMQMTELVRAAMAGVAPDAHLGRRPGLVDTWPLETAIRHAADILAPVASAHSITISLALDPSIAPLRAGTLYAPVAAAVRNAIESIQRTRRGRGEITISARIGPDELTPLGTAVIEIADDGVGPPALPTGHEARVFELGFTTKRASPHATGIGLSMVRDAVHALGGSVELAPRAGGGAVLRIIYPVREHTTPAAGGPTPC